MIPYVSDPDFTLYQGDAREALAALPDASVHCAVTSPPYYALRDYGVAGQIGLEDTLDEFVGRLVDVFAEVRRVLHPTGTVWLNLGDTYSAAPRGPRHGRTSKLTNPERQERVSPVVDKRGARAGAKPKDLLLVPFEVAFALRADGWWLRQVVVWEKPNPIPESAKDRPTTSHEYVLLLSRASRYFYDAEAVKEPALWERWGAQTQKKDVVGRASLAKRLEKSEIQERYAPEPGRTGWRNLRSVWSFPTQPFSEAHFATFPQELVRRCVMAGTSEHGVCGACGAPWKRLVDVDYVNPGNRTTNGPRSIARKHEPAGTAGFAQRLERRSETVGWEATCPCDVAHVPATVLDPFLGSGTTALVARKLGRRAVGVELNPDYCAIAARRLSQLSLLAEEPAA